jgi:hypothetical protein
VGEGNGKKDGLAGSMERGNVQIMSRPSLVVIGLIGFVLFLAGAVMIARVMMGEPYIIDPMLEERAVALYSNGGGILLFSIYYFAIGAGAILVCTSMTALFFRRRN